MNLHNLYNSFHFFQLDLIVLVLFTFYFILRNPFSMNLFLILSQYDKLLNPFNYLIIN